MNREAERFQAKVNSLVDGFYRVSGIRNGPTTLNDVHVLAGAGISILCSAFANMPEHVRNDMLPGLPGIISREITDRVAKVAKRRAERGT